MLPPKIESSSVEERRAWIKSTFQCKADCDSCGLCKVYGGRDMEEVYADYIEGTKSFEQVARENRRI